MPSKPKKSSIKKVASKQIKNSAKQTRATAKQLRSLAKAISKSAEIKPVKVAQVKREIKREVKQSKHTVKAGAKAFRQIAKSISDARELAKIERLLGEDFDSLAEARRELKKQTKPAVKKTQSKKSSPAKKSVSFSGKKKASVKSSAVIKPTESKSKKQAKKKISLQMLKARKGESLLEYSARLESYGDLPDEILGGRGNWIFNYGSGKSKIMHGNFQSAMHGPRGIMSYDLSKAIVDGREDEEIEERLLRSIKFMVSDENEVAYVTEREDQRKARQNERQREKRAAIKQLKEQGLEEPSIFGGAHSIMMKQQELIDKLLKERKKDNANSRTNQQGRKKRATKTKGKS